MKYLTNLNLEQNQLQNAVVGNEVEAPLSPKEGQIYYDTVDHRIYWHNGTTWVAADAADALASLNAEDIVALINESSEIIDLDNIPSEVITESELSTILANYSLTSHNHTLDSLSNVTIGIKSAGQVVYWNGTSWVNQTLVAADISDFDDEVANNTDVAANTAARHTHVNLPLLETYTQTETDLADAVARVHTQNTDTGTDSVTFQIGTAGPKVKNSSGTLEARTAADDDYADFKAKNVTVEGDLVVKGTTTTIESNTVAIGDNEIELNSDITAAIQNSDGGITIKRLADDDVTRADAKLTYSESEDRWTQTYGPTAALVTSVLPVKLVGAIEGDGEATSFVITHNLASRDVSVTIRENFGSYEMVMADVSFGINAVTIDFAQAPAEGEDYSVIIIG